METPIIGDVRIQASSVKPATRASGSAISVSAASRPSQTEQVFRTLLVIQVGREHPRRRRGAAELIDPCPISDIMSSMLIRRLRAMTSDSVVIQSLRLDVGPLPGQISFAKLGDATFSARLRATGGSLDGFEVVQTGVQSGDVVVGMTVVGLDGSDTEDATIEAVQKVERDLRYRPVDLARWSHRSCERADNEQGRCPAGHA